MKPTQATAIRTHQFHKLTLKRIIKDYKSGLLTAKGAVFYLFSASHRPGATVRVNPLLITSALGISRSTFYAVLSKLKLENRLHFEAEGNLIVCVQIEGATDGNDEKKLSDISDNKSDISDNKSEDSDNKSEISDNKSEDSEYEPLKLPLCNGFSASLDILDITDIKDIEREQKNDQEETFLMGFKNWLLNKANSLPKRPTFTEQWLEKELKKPANQREFAQYQASLAAVPIPEILPIENLGVQDYWAVVQQRQQQNDR